MGEPSQDVGYDHALILPSSIDSENLYIPLAEPVSAIREKVWESSVSMPEVRTLESRNFFSGFGLGKPWQVGEIDDTIGCAV
jgi:hypothetical protein